MAKTAKVKKYNVKDPITIYDCDYGLISKDKLSNIFTILDKKLGEFIEVYCVAKDKKPLAALDFSTRGKNLLRKLDKSLINKVIQYSNYKNVKALHNKKTGGMYLKTIFLHKRIIKMH